MTRAGKAKASAAAASSGASSPPTACATTPAAASTPQAPRTYTFKKARAIGNLVAGSNQSAKPRSAGHISGTIPTYQKGAHEGETTNNMYLNHLSDVGRTRLRGRRR